MMKKQGKKKWLIAQVHHKHKATNHTLLSCKDGLEESTIQKAASEQTENIAHYLEFPHFWVLPYSAYSSWDSTMGTTTLIFISSVLRYLHTICKQTAIPTPWSSSLHILPVSTRTTRMAPVGAFPDDPQSLQRDFKKSLGSPPILFQTTAS